MWKEVIDKTLNIFANFTDFVDFLFEWYAVAIPEPENDIIDALFGWFVDWVNSWGFQFQPIGLFGISTFLIWFVIVIVKLVF